MSMTRQSRSRRVLPYTLIHGVLNSRNDRAEKPHHYPRGVCPHCMSTNLEWREAKGTGEIYTYSIMHAAKPAYVVAYVTLDEGVSMMTNIVDVDPGKVKVGQRVKVVFKPSEGGGKLPCFTPV